MDTADSNPTANLPNDEDVQPHFSAPANASRHKKSQAYLLQESKRRDHPIFGMHIARAKRSPSILMEVLSLITEFSVLVLHSFC